MILRKKTVDINMYNNTAVKLARLASVIDLIIPWTAGL
jgi:hypothetical protein